VGSGSGSNSCCGTPSLLSLVQGNDSRHSSRTAIGKVRTVMVDVRHKYPPAVIGQSVEHEQLLLVQRSSSRRGDDHVLSSSSLVDYNSSLLHQRYSCCIVMRSACTCVHERG
jgi:hypothetical protein